MIAMAIACKPQLLIADEPTTALDVTVQAQVLDLLLRLQREQGMALLLITHDLAIVAETARRVMVMYAGQAVETGAVPAIFDAPRHPYTQALPRRRPSTTAIGPASAIPGVVPGQHDRPTGCLLHPRCDYAPRAPPPRTTVAPRPAGTAGPLPLPLDAEDIHERLAAREPKAVAEDLNPERVAHACNRGYDPPAHVCKQAVP
jgi:oligopeptide/dipeptide ABC transporter ATP-binding protein